jgi:DNA topoisomerase-1
MMEYKFTKDVESDFDTIATGEHSYVEVLKEFWEGSLQKDLEHAGANAEKVIEKTGEKCPDCTADLIFRHSKAGKFIGCSAYPECKFVDQPKEEKDALSALREKYEGKPCPDGIEGTIVVKTGRYGPFLTSSAYPAVKWI